LVATVNASGQVTGVATGLATITATTNDGSYTASSSITVANPVTGVSILPGYVSLKVDSTVQLKAIVEPSDADTTVAWSSSNTALATVDSTGLVTGISAGWVNITVKTNDGGKTATITISVTKNTTTSVIDETIADATGMLVYPNPVTGQLKVVLGNEFTNDAAIQLFDNTGRMVVNQKSNGSENIIHMESLSPGLYLVKVSSGGKSAVQQIIKK
jgi:uncharacterized protein YjdB